MERESKTVREIYMQTYDRKEIAKSSLIAIEAIGYLRCLLQFFPAEKWIEKEMKTLKLLVLMINL